MIRTTTTLLLILLSLLLVENNRRFQPYSTATVEPCDDSEGEVTGMCMCRLKSMLADRNCPFPKVAHLN
jgi:hypothetical protein